MKVRMISPDGSVSIISEQEACLIRNNVFMRPGNVKLSQIENGYCIVDSQRTTILTAIIDDVLEELK